MHKRLVIAALLVPAVASAGFRASSFKKETRLGANYWNAASALDAKPDTCWMIDAESDQVGEWIEIDLPTGKTTVDKLSVITGWMKDDSTFKDYSRIKAAKIEVFGNESDENAKVLEQTITFEDKIGWQTIDLPDTAVGGELNGGRVRLTVTEIYAGEDYSNLAVSEVLVRLKEIDVPAGTVKVKTPPATSAPAHGPELMADGDAKTYWAAGGAGDVSFDVRAESFGVSSIGIQPGPLTNARPKTVEVTASDVTVTYTLADKPEVQWFDLPAVVGYTGSSWNAVNVHVLDSYPGKTDQALAIGEVKMRYTNFEGL